MTIDIEKLAQDMFGTVLVNGKEYYEIDSEEWKNLAEAYMQEQGKLAERSEPVAWQFFKDGIWWYGNQDEYHKQKTYEAGLPIRNLYTTPQRVEASSTGVATRQLKRLSDEQINEICEEWRDYGYRDLANAIMDEMQELNK